MQNRTYFKLIVFILCLGVATLFVAPVFAADAEPAPATTSSSSKLLRGGLDQAAATSGLKTTTSSVNAVIGLVVQEALKYLSILFIILMLYAGIRWMTASGDPAKVKEARSWIINATIGFIVTLMAYQVVYFVIDSIKIEGSAPTVETTEEAPVEELMGPPTPTEEPMGPPTPTP